MKIGWAILRILIGVVLGIIINSGETIMRDRKLKSKTLGYLPGWRNGPSMRGYLVYEALVELECVHCGITIKPGDKFARTGIKGGGNRTFPTCKKCI